MFDNSVIKKTGQWWKFLLAYFGILVGGVGMIYGFPRLDQEYALVWAIGGWVLTFASFVFGCVSIRCPACKEKWIWRMFCEKEHQWGIPWLLGRDDCPICKQKFHGELV
ncbi:MAG: MerC family mercury resistance protein [Candidatus Zixiibacteriota bacterium]|nr:MAG: MerC family mercury resistance protein [candidate division Zixibacteria bacterium]